MIAINKRLAREALANAVGSGRVTPASSPHAYLLQALVHLNHVFDVEKDSSLFLPLDFTLDDWTNVEIVAADAAIWLIAYLRQLGCKDIEKLLRDVSDYRSRHPDRPNGAWPYDKGPR